MKRLIIRAAFFCAVMSVFALAASGQPRTGDGPSIAAGVAKVPVIVVGTAGKIVWQTTKFTAKHVAKPVIVGAVKPLLLKFAPRAAVFVLKLAGSSIKKTVPVASRLGFAYLKAKLPV